MITVRHILDAKGSTVWSISPSAGADEAIRMMGEMNVGALAVVEGDALAGIVSERDYLRKVVLAGGPPGAARVRDIMTANVHTVKPEHSVEHCMEMVTEKHVRHLPVVEGGRLVGMISIGDVVKALISEQDSTISHLKNYITGSR